MHFNEWSIEIIITILDLQVNITTGFFHVNPQHIGACDFRNYLKHTKKCNQSNLL